MSGEKEEKKREGVPPHEVYIDFKGKSDQELRAVLEELLREERRISYQRRVLHGKIDMLRAELVRRKKEGLRKGESLITEEDIRKLSEILAGEAMGVSDFDLESE
jgi:hypothetical protein